MKIILIVAVIAIAAIIVHYKTQASYLVSRYAQGNVLTFGRRGCGKDLLHNYVIRKRHRKCFSNIAYDSRYAEQHGIDELTVAPNTYENFIEGNIVQVEKDETREGKDYYLSDGGVYLPSQYNSALDKQYKSMPIYMALSRHLYNSNVHVNTQALGRVWNKVREQADTYVQAVHTWSLGILYITKWRAYDKVSSAEAELRPFRAGIISSKEKKARKEEHRALYGEIVEGYIIQWRWQIKYDTRAFARIIFKEEEGGKASPIAADPQATLGTEQHASPDHDTLPPPPSTLDAK